MCLVEPDVFMKAVQGQSGGQRVSQVGEDLDSQIRLQPKHFSLYSFVCMAVEGWLGAFQVAPVVKNLPANAGDARNVDLILGWEDPLEQEMAIQPSILTRKIPWTGESGRLQSIGSKRVGHS